MLLKRSQIFNDLTTNKGCENNNNDDGVDDDDWVLKSLEYKTKAIELIKVKLSKSAIKLKKFVKIVL